MLSRAGWLANMLDEGERAEQFEFEQLRSTTTSLLPLLHPSSSSAPNINNTFHHIPLIILPNYNNNSNPSTSTSNSHSPHDIQFPLETLTQTNLFHPSILSLPNHSPNTITFNSNAINFQIQTNHHQLPPPLIDSRWTNNEILALFKITSTIHNFFPDQLITWDHVSSKLAELGIKKSAEKCKEKFEHENTSFFKIHNNPNNNNNNFTGFVSELQDLYQGGGVAVDEQQNLDEKENTQLEEEDSRDDIVVTKQCDDDDDKVMMEKSKNKKRKRRRGRFEMLKSFCEKVVNTVIAQQEEIHNKLLEDMLKRDEEKLAKEEEWKKQEIERMNMMAQQQAIANDRQANIIEFLKKYLATGYSSFSSSSSQLHSQNPNNLESTTPCSNVIADQNPSSSDTEYSNSTSTLVVPTIMEKLEDKRRWPRDEVLALINLKSTTSVLNKSNNINNNVEEKELGKYKGPLWERISEGMSELGYKRSAKRCKEKWENINKYFKKTKDIAMNKKKRSLDSRTCPYFHQLTSLYNQQQQEEGKLIAQSSDSPMGSDVV